MLKLEIGSGAAVCIAASQAQLCKFFLFCWVRCRAKRPALLAVRDRGGLRGGAAADLAPDRFRFVSYKNEITPPNFTPRMLREITPYICQFYFVPRHDDWLGFFQCSRTICVNIAFRGAVATNIVNNFRKTCAEVVRVKGAGVYG